MIYYEFTFPKPRRVVSRVGEQLIKTRESFPGRYSLKKKKRGINILWL